MPGYLTVAGIAAAVTFLATFGVRALAPRIGAIALPDVNRSVTTHQDNWDAIIGVKGRYGFGQGSPWFLPYHLDVGAGNSKSTVQAVAGVGYAFGWGDITGTWRYLSYHMKSDSRLQDLTFSGPMVSAVFHW